MKKNTKILVTVIFVLAAIIAVTALLNMNNAAKQKELNEKAVFLIMENGKEAASFKMDEIIGMGETSFYANLKKNGKEPVRYEYTGVLLKNLFDSAGIDLNGKESVIVTAADGYTVAVDISKVMENDNVYLAYKQEGKYLGTREDGGSGPYQMIISRDRFSQYWCKFALSAEAK